MCALLKKNTQSPYFKACCSGAFISMPAYGELTNTECRSGKVSRPRAMEKYHIYIDTSKGRGGGYVVLIRRGTGGLCGLKVLWSPYRNKGAGSSTSGIRVMTKGNRGCEGKARRHQITWLPKVT